MGTPRNTNARVSEVIRSAQTDLETDILKVLQTNRDHRYSYDELSERFDRSRGSVKAAVFSLAEQGYAVREKVDGDYIHLPRESVEVRPPQSIDFRGEELVFGVVSDTHLGSNAAALDMLESAYDLFAEEGVDTVFHCGDLTEGPGNVGYRGHNNDVLECCQTWKGIEEYASEMYPRRDGMRTLCISSSKSHDGWEWNKSGRCPTADICNGRSGVSPLEPREDMEWLGHDVADVLIGPEDRTRVRLFHPDGGSAYALTYHTQKFVEAMPGGTKPHLFFIGHYHQYCSTRFRNVEVCMVPGMQWKTNFLARFGREPVVGALLFHVRLDAEGSLRAVRCEDLIHYYVTGQPHAA